MQVTSLYPQDFNRATYKESTAIKIKAIGTNCGHIYISDGSYRLALRVHTFVWQLFLARTHNKEIYQCSRWMHCELIAVNHMHLNLEYRDIKN